MTARAAAAVPFAAAAAAGRRAGRDHADRQAAGPARRGRRPGGRRRDRGTGRRDRRRAGWSRCRPRPLPDKLYIAIDGTGVPMIAAETEGRDGKGEDGKARTREVKMAVAFTQTTVDEDGYPVRDPASSSYLATFAPAAGFGILMAAEARRRGAGHVRQLTILGDGARVDLEPRRPALPRRHPDRRPVPRPRAPARPRQDCSSSCSATSYDDWLAERLAELDDGDIPAIWPPPAPSRWPAAKPATGTRPCTTSRPTPTACTTRASAPCGLFVGSGAVEAGCKSVIGQRLKLSGMRLDRTRRHRHPHPALPGSQRPLGQKSGRSPATTPSSLTQHLTHAAHSDHPGQRKLPASHLHSCPTPQAPSPGGLLVRPGTMGG